MTSSEEFDLIGIQAQIWLGYEIPVYTWLSIDLGLFLTYDGMNPKEDDLQDRDIKKGPRARTLTYRTLGIGAQANFDLF